MKAENLMIGDWVKTKDIESAKVSFVNNYGDIGLDIDTDIDSYPFIISEILPIPLTEEILIANGFISLNYDTCFVYRCNELEQDFEITKDKHGYHLRPVVIAKMQYVHELQHALRICGLSELADNFKI